MSEIEPKRTSPPEPIIVGVGASAGGLEALRLLFTKLTDVTQCCFVVVQHLSPDHRSLLSTLLAKETELIVRDIVDGEKPEAGRVYVTPPNADVTLENGHLKLAVPDGRISPKPSIDSFFTSLANDQKERSVGIVLSGTGSDGAHGLRAIKAAGGVTIAQTPATAKYDGMPRSAINTGIVDHVMSPESIAVDFIPSIDEFVAGTHQPIEIGDDPFREILALLKKRLNVDFNLYKPNTIQRRLKRRMDTNKTRELDDYLKLVQKDPNELKSLFQDILINVTEFFRDPEEFDFLKSEVRRFLEQKSADEPFRVWVAGCATGEEAYSVAIMLHELFDRSDAKRIQIFATDIDEYAMNLARKGTYPAAGIKDLDPQLVERNFSRVDNCFRIKKVIREMVVFARHDLTQDPPFMKMDLITCRNVFIYLDQAIQAQILRIFHYALNRNGMLFLGKSENISGTNANFFAQPNNRHRLFRRTDRAPEGQIRFSTLEFDQSHGQRIETRAKGTDLNAVTQAFLAALAPDAVVVDENFEVKHIAGRAADYLAFPQGSLDRTLSKLVLPSIRDTSMALLYRARTQQRHVIGGRISIEIAEQSRTIRLEATPLQVEGAVAQYIFIFRDVTGQEVAPTTPQIEGQVAYESIQALERELYATREHLQTVVEEQETANEELQALNEELNSANEELQSTNEELETSNEELQSTNEELTTLNEELNTKSNELIELNDYLESIQNAINHPLFMVDRNMNLIRYNRSVKRTFHIDDRDLGKNIRLLTGPFYIPEVFEAVERCVRTGTQISNQLAIGDETYQIQADPIVNHRGEFEGAVVSFIDNTVIVRSLNTVALKEAQIQAILSNTPALVSIKDASGRYTLANKRFCDFARASSPDEIVGKTDDEIFGEEHARTARGRDLEVLRERRPIVTQDPLAANGQESHFLSSKFPILDPGGNPEAVCTISLDVTERVDNERKLELFKHVIASSCEGILIFRAIESNFEAIFVNQAFESITGYGEKAVLGKSIGELLSSIMVDAQGIDVPSLKTAIRSGRHIRFEVIGKRANGTPIWLELRFSHHMASDEQVEHTLVLLFDITDRKRAEETILVQQEELLRAGKLAALGEMAAGIAHELNTPLNSIQAQVDLLEELATEDSIDKRQLLEATDGIERTVGNIAGIIRGLRVIAKMDQTHEKKLCNVREIVTDTIKLCEFHLKNKGVQLDVAFPDGTLRVLCNSIQITQVLINLINNAVDAIKNLPARWIRVEVSTNDDEITIKVIDSGDGVPANLAEKIMTPFFTTKRHGTGLGLSLSKSIINSHGGRLELDLNGQHTCFQVSLPLPAPGER